MQKVVDCKLEITRLIGNNEEKTTIKGKGYCRTGDELVVYFSSEEFKYKYVYKDNKLIVFCNDSKYSFRENKEDIGEIKSDDFTFKITTLASKIEVAENTIVLEYALYQQDLIGRYYTKLSFN